MKSVACKHGISVIIPTFNRASYLYSTLICLCNQKVAEGVEYEIVIVDSGDDETESVVRLFQNPENVPVIYKKIKKCSNRSLVRNRGASLARYSILCFLDNDMLTPPDFIQRHYDEHQKQNHLVVMGCRRSLTEFDISALGEDTLRNNFDILEKLPWYADERLEIYEDKDQWRFVFSHTLSIEAEDFYKAGQFNVEFGEHWGYEDLELGFNLMQTGCSFLLIKDSFTYHQPHFSQSNREQHEARWNKDLFVSLHNCYEVELYAAFYIDYIKFYDKLKSLATNFEKPPKKITKEFDIILGCLFPMERIESDCNFQLGVYIPIFGKKVKKILILDTFFAFPKLIQISILSEAFRISENVFFHSISEEHKNTVIYLCKETGLAVCYISESCYAHFYLETKIKSRFIAIQLPEIYCPEKRAVYFWISSKLYRNGVSLIVMDMHSIKTMTHEDLRLSSQDDIHVLSESFTNYLGSANFQAINSFSVLHSDRGLSVQDNEDCYIIHDDDFLLNSELLKYRGCRKSNHVSEAAFADFTFAAAGDAVQNWKNHDVQISDNLTFCCFMENGYLEDGIDIILKSLSKLISQDSSVRLIIKMPDYRDLFTDALPMHNKVSKENKFFDINQKLFTDYSLLLSEIDRLKIQDFVTIVSKNITLAECCDLISRCSMLLFASRACYVPIQIYIGILLGKKVVMAEHHNISVCCKDSVLIAKSECFDFPNELNVPVTCTNIMYSAFQICLSDFVKKIEEGKKYLPEKSNYEAIYLAICNSVRYIFVEDEKRNSAV